MQKTFIIKGKVWKYDGPAAWHFVYIDKEIAQEVKKSFTGKKVGFGFIPVSATVGKTTWETAIFPNKKENNYLIALKGSIRRKECIYEGDSVTITFSFLQ